MMAVGYSLVQREERVASKPCSGSAFRMTNLSNRRINRAEITETKSFERVIEIHCLKM